MPSRGTSTAHWREASPRSLDTSSWRTKGQSTARRHTRQRQGSRRRTEGRYTPRRPSRAP
eukprot:986871-Prymnesium_polylepis.1